MRSLGSDNHSGVHPQILESLLQANSNHDSSYGTDSSSKALEKMVKEEFGSEWLPLFCFNGTAANVLCLRSLVDSFHSVICSDISHLNLDECGAPEKILGIKLITTKSTNGKIDLNDLKKKIIRLGDQHYSQVGAVSITQPTELGTCYSLGEIEKIKVFCDEHNLKLHIDGARLSNAVYSLNSSFKEICEYADAVSFGGTKNGLLGCEIVLVKNKKNMKFFRKQFLQLPSKTRFFAVQFITYLKDKLYLEISKNSCLKAQLLASEIMKNTDIKPNYPVESNAVFINLKKEDAKKLKKEMFFYTWDEISGEVRLMTSFDTTEVEIKNFVQKLRGILK